VVDAFTFTHKGLSGPNDLRALLEPYDIDLLVDCRYERGHGDNHWSSELIEDTARRAGLHYHWDKGLGNPDYRIPGSRYPNSKPATRIADERAIEPLVEYLNRGLRLALMCVCTDHLHCHRRIIIDALLRRVADLRVTAI